jgi:DNA mismatch repair protein MutS
MNAPTPMMAQYLEIKRQYSEYLLFYRMGDFYEVFFDDAINAASALDIALTKRGQHNGADIPMAGVPVHSHEVYLLKLIEKGFCVAVCEQIETPEQAKARGAKGPLKRDVVRLITPGTLTEESLLTPKKANYLLAISFNKKQSDGLGCAWVDISTGNFYTETIAFEKLEAYLHKINASEILLPESLWQQIDTSIFETFKNQIKPLADARFNLNSAIKNLCDTYKVLSPEVIGLCKAELIQACGVIVEYLNLTQKSEISFLKNPKNITSQNYLKVDAQTLRNLEIVQTLKGTYQGSLLHSLDNTQTAFGGRLFYQMLVNPLADIALIENRKTNLNFFINTLEIATKIQQILKGTPDLERSLTRIALNRAYPRDLKAIQICLEKTALIKELLAAQPFWQIPDLSNLLDELQNTLNDELPATTNEGGIIRKGFNQKLDEMLELRDNGHNQLKELEQKYRSITGINNLKIRCNNLIGYYIEVSASHQNKVPDFFKHKQAIANGTRYISEELIELSSQINNAATAVISLELQIFQNLCSNINTQKQNLEQLAEILAEIDVYSAFAIYTKNHNYCIPELNSGINLSINAGRHPIVEQFTKESFIANDCYLNDNLFSLLTGPNMAGKSTYLRQNALIVWMAHCGLAVPAQKATIGLIDQLFCRIGAADDLAAGRSTFMVEMVETASILHQATSKSFIILDEIGRGTSTQDGLAIARSVSEYIIHTTKARCIFATHYHELVELAAHLPVQLLTVKIIENETQVIFLHEIIKGAADKSYGIHVAELAGLPMDVIDRAKTLLKNTNQIVNPNISENVGAPYPTAYNSSENQVVKLIKSLKPDELTPKEALRVIYELQDKLEGKTVKPQTSLEKSKQAGLFF